MKIDIHAHIVERRYVEELTDVLGLKAERGLPGQVLLRRDGKTYAWHRESMFDIDARLRDMDAKGIDMRVVSLSAPNVYPWPLPAQIEVARRINDATARLVRARPDRFAGFASLPLADPEASLAELDRAVGELGMVGVTIGSNVDGVPMNDRRFEPVWARLNQLALPVFEHPVFPAYTGDMEEFELPLRVGFVFDTTLALARMIYGGVFERYPDFPYIVAHTGGTLLMLIERLDNGYKLFPDCRAHITKPPSEFAKRLYYDTCSFFTPALMMAHGYVGADRILFGTDDPFINTGSAHVDELPISRSDKDKILGDNARRVLKLGR
jgi:aminocarboxymuconate-semialdehyde decarboxylase